MYICTYLHICTCRESLYCRCYKDKLLHILNQSNTKGHWLHVDRSLIPFNRIHLHTTTNQVTVHSSFSRCTLYVWLMMKGQGVNMNTHADAKLSNKFKAVCVYLLWSSNWILLNTFSMVATMYFQKCGFDNFVYDVCCLSYRNHTYIRTYGATCMYVYKIIV